MESAFQVGITYNRRKDIHAKFGGQQQGGIATPAGFPAVFLFTAPSGHAYGYGGDGWSKDGVFLYTGEGQVGHMEFRGGNRAIRDHLDNRKQLFVFEALPKGGDYIYLGEFACSSWEWSQARDKTGNMRKVILFHLIQLDEHDGENETQFPAVQSSAEQLRVDAYKIALSAPEDPIKESRRRFYERSATVKAYVLSRAAGMCEACRSPAPFTRPDGTPYLEPHHIDRVSDGGPDHPQSVAAICPNCHRHIHHGQGGPSLNVELRKCITQKEQALGPVQP